MPDQPDFSELTSFDKSALRKIKTDEKNPLPDKAAIEEEKSQADN